MSAKKSKKDKPGSASQKKDEAPSGNNCSFKLLFYNQDLLPWYNNNSTRYRI